MPKETVRTPQSILDDLVREAEQRKEYDLQKRLKKAETLLPAMAQPQYERHTDDVLAGVIAAILHEFCCKKHPAPIVMVCDPDTKKTDAAQLKMAVSILQQMGCLERMEIVVKEPARRYLCLKRLRNAEANGNTFPPKLERRLLVDKLDKAAASKVCVTTCSKGCSFRSECRYQLLMQNISDGRIPLLVYDVQQYQAALRANKLPKARLTVCSPRGGRIQLDDGSRTVKAKDLERLLLQSERLCSSARHKKVAVLQETEAVRECSRLLFAMADGEKDELAARFLLANINSHLQQIRRMCVKELSLWGDERARWSAGLNRAIADTEAMMEQDFSISQRTIILS